jgi:hypothetical protein
MAGSSSVIYSNLWGGINLLWSGRNEWTWHAASSLFGVAGRNLDFFNLRENMLSDPEFACQMIYYLDSIISECIDSCENDNRSDGVPRPLIHDFESDQEYVEELYRYGNAVASKRQIHSLNHNSTCFKYGNKGQRACRFYFPRPKVEASHIDGLRTG